MNSLTNVKWSKFYLRDFFNVKRGKSKNITTRNKNVKNGIPVISAKIGNGLSGFYKKNNFESVYNNVITVNNNGSVGLTYFHNYSFMASSDVSILLPKININNLALKFIVVCIQKNAIDKFSYSYKISNERLLKTKIFLPVDNEGKPNWSFMENYIKELENKKINEILSHLNHTHTR